MKRIVLVVLALVSGWTVVVLFFAFQFMFSPAQQESQEIIFFVEPGPFSLTAQNLAAQGLTQDAFRMRVLAKLTGYANKARVGEYRLNTSMTPMQILETISSGRTVQHPFTMPEGLNIFEISALMEAQKLFTAKAVIAKCYDRVFLQKLLSDTSIESCEGYLFPETYSFTKNMNLEAVMGMMIKKFLENYQAASAPYPAYNLSRHQVVTLASIIEKETGAESERTLVSSVYQNRLKIGMRLQADPTVLYGKMDISRKFENNITRQDLITPNRYNTYAMKGLPVGPIANPGLESLKAVFTPAVSEYLYFVSKNDGTHVFSKDFSAHNTHVQNLQKRPEARKGKSWRDLNKPKVLKANESKASTQGTARPAPVQKSKSRRE